MSDQQRGFDDCTQQEVRHDVDRRGFQQTRAPGVLDSR